MNSGLVKQQHNRALTMAVAFIALTLFLAACAFDPTELGFSAGEPVIVAGGSAERGEVALHAYGCGSCHSIPGIVGANGLVGPPLEDWADRKVIVGSFPNEPRHLISWIRFPQAIEPGNAMPNMGVTEQEARDMSAYLYTLGGD